MFRTLDRYVIRQVLPPFLIGLLVFTFILEIPPLADVAEKLIAKGVSWSVIGRIMATLLPQALGVTIPMSLLLGLLVAFGRLSGDREWVALQACGVSLYRVLQPVAVLSVIAWAATSYILMEAVPSANQTFREITYNIVAARAEGEVKPRVFFEDFPNTVLYVRDVRPGGGWADVFVADTTQPSEPVVYLARRGHMVLDRTERRVEMALEQGSRHSAKISQPDTYEVQRFDRLVLSLDPESVFPRSGPQKGDREMRIPELRARVEELRGQGLSPHGPIMEIHAKFSIPVACLVFALIGLALGLTNRRDGKLASFVLGIAVIFVYYVIMWTSQSLAKGQLLPARLAMWVPNILLGGAGLALFLWRARSADQPIRIALPFRRGARPGADAPGPVDSSAPAAAPAPAGPRVLVVIRVPQVSVPKPSLLDLYVARLYARGFGLAFAGLVCVFYISTFIDLSDKLFKGTTTLATILRYFWFATPQFVYYIIPIAVLIASLVTIGLLTKHSELVVMKACGISLYRVAVPLLLVASLGSGVLFALEERVLAYSNRRAEAIRHVIRGGSPRTFDVLNRKWLVGREGAIYHYVYFDPRRRELNGLSIYEFAPGFTGLRGRTFATQAAYVAAAERPGLAVWRAQQGWIREFESRRGPHGYMAFAERRLLLEPPDYFVTERPDAERMNYVQLKRYIAELRTSGYNVVPYAVALQRKLSFPWVTIIMTLIAVPFAVTTGNRGAMYGVGVGIVLAILYWTTISVFAAIGGGGLIAPTLAAWAPNVLFGAAAAYLLLTVRT